MSKRFALVDLSNMFHRARYGAMAMPEEQAGMAFLILFRCLRKLYRDLRIDHIVFATDQGSWRETVYPSYKSRRKLERLAQSPRQQAEQAVFFAAFDALRKFLSDHTRCTVLTAEAVEADDFVARWIARHPHDHHIIVSADSDFVQLLADNVQIFDALNQRMISIDCVLDEHGQRLAFSVSPKDGKVRIGQPDAEFVPEPEWWRKALFVKLIRGDTSDSVFSAYPGVRYDSKRCSIRAAWEDRQEQGYDWNNLMFQTWDKLLEGGAVRAVRVIDEYRANEQLIDLTKQPADIIGRIDAAIDAAVTRPAVKQIGAYFLRFCATHDLPVLAKEATEHVAYLNAPYH
jgi:hypothetical protein